MAQTVTSASSLYETVHDPVYSVLSKQVSIDADTSRKSTRKIPASSNGSATVTTGLHGKRTEFNFGNGTTFRMRWDTTRLNVAIKFLSALDTDGAISAANGICCSPPWNLFDTQW